LITGGQPNTMRRRNYITQSGEIRTVDFTDHELGRITRSLPQEADKQRLALIPNIIRDWARNELLGDFLHKPDPAEIRNEHYRRFKEIEAAAILLSEALSALDEGERWDLILKIACPPDDFPHGLAAASIDRAVADLNETRVLSCRLTAAARAAAETQVPRRGPARDDVPYLILNDLAEIFKWAAGAEPTRRVDRITNEDSGPFHRFAAAVWPVIFGSDDGLSSALKIWAADGKMYRERSPVLLNLDLRHPEWGIFGR
jgi:hypothetical protein